MSKNKMVKVTVKKSFLDRYTGITHKQGDVLTVSDSRYREIQHSGDFVEVMKEKAVAKK